MRLDEREAARQVDDAAASGIVWTVVVALVAIVLMVVLIRVAWAAVKLVWLVIPVVLALFVVVAVLRHRSQRGRVSGSARP